MSNTQKPVMTAEESQREAHERLLGGTEPFNDGDTPERKAFREQRVAEFNKQQEAKKNKANARQDMIARVPALRLAQAMKLYTFESPLTNDEKKKVEKVLKIFEPVPRIGPEGLPVIAADGLPEYHNPGKEARKGFNLAILRYVRAQFYAGREMHVLVTKRHRDTGDVARIADLARYIFWKYRKPGCFGTEIGDADLNFSLHRVRNDLICEPGLVALLNEYCADLLTRGVFSDDPLKWVSKSTVARKQKHFRNSTVMARMDAITIRMDEISKAPAVAKLDEDLKAAVSHYTTAHGVTINALNELQKKEEADAKAVVFLTNTVLRLLTRVEELERRPSPMFIPPAPILEPGYTPHYPTPGWEITCENKSESVAENPPSVQ